MISKKDIAVRRVRHQQSLTTKIEGLLAIKSEQFISDKMLPNTMNHETFFKVVEDEVRQEVFRFIYGDIKDHAMKICPVISEMEIAMGPASDQGENILKLHNWVNELFEMLKLQDKIVHMDGQTPLN